MSWLSNLFGGGGSSNPAQSAMPYFDQAASTERQYLDPYIQRGQGSGDILSEQFGQMSQDPAAVLERLMGGYEPSKGYQMMQDRMGQAAANTAAAGGMRGSPLEQTQQQELTQGLLSKDMQQYLQNVLGLQTQGLAGEQGLYGTSFDAARGLSGDLANILGTKGQLEFQGQREGQQRGQDLLSSLMGLGGTILGAGIGGPAGATAGGSIGGDLYKRFFGGG